MGSLDDVKKRNTFSSTILLTRVNVADKLVLVNTFDEITICSLFNGLFIRCFKLNCTARVIDCKHRPQRRHQKILYCTLLYGG